MWGGNQSGSPTPALGAPATSVAYPASSIPGTCIEGPAIIVARTCSLLFNVFLIACHGEQRQVAPRGLARGQPEVPYRLAKVSHCLAEVARQLTPKGAEPDVGAGASTRNLLD